MQAIQAGTSVAAELLEWEDRVGTVEAGKLADIIAVSGDPLERELAQQESVLDGLLSDNLGRLNELAKEEGVPYVVTP